MAKHEYRILSRSRQGDLADIVEQFLNGGWQLVGGVFVHTETEYVQKDGYAQVKERGTVYYQAIVRTITRQPMGKVEVDGVEVPMYSEN